MRADALIPERPALQITNIGESGRSYSSSYNDGSICSDSNYEQSVIDNGIGGQCWLACYTERDEGYINAYLQIDLGHDCGGCSKTLWGVVTQGRGEAAYQRALSYRVKITTDADSAT